MDRTIKLELSETAYAETILLSAAELPPELADIAEDKELIEYQLEKIFGAGRVAVKGIC